MENTYTLTLKNDYLFKLLLGSEENKPTLNYWTKNLVKMR